MSYKPTNEDLIAYLYNELGQEEKARIESYFKSNPEAKRELESMESTRMVMNDWEDEEIPLSPPLLIPQANDEWLYWRKYVAIAATILFIVTIGWASGFRLNYSESGLQLGFGEIQNGLSPEEVKVLLAQNTQEVYDLVSQNMGVMKDSLNNKMQTLEAGLNHHSDLLQNVPLTKSEIDLNIAQEKALLVSQMADLSNQMKADYREIFRELIVSFSDNWQSQRLEDLNSIQAAFTRLEDATINKHLEIEDALIDLSNEVRVMARNTPNNK